MGFHRRPPGLNHTVTPVIRCAQFSVGATLNLLQVDIGIEVQNFKA